jgi:hypothetical protein
MRGGGDEATSKGPPEMMDAYRVDLKTVRRNTMNALVVLDCCSPSSTVCCAAGLDRIVSVFVSSCLVAAVIIDE